MTAKEQTRREAKIRDAMVSLVGNPNFVEFIGIIREQREVIIEDLCSERVLASERLTLAAIGELRNNKNILAIFDEFKNRPEAQAQDDLE